MYRPMLTEPVPSLNLRQLNLLELRSVAKNGPLADWWLTPALTTLIYNVDAGTRRNTNSATVKQRHNSHRAVTQQQQ